jgi:hypothetical protein
LHQPPENFAVSWNVSHAHNEVGSTTTSAQVGESGALSFRSPVHLRMAYFVARATRKSFGYVPDRRIDCRVAGRILIRIKACDSVFDYYS